MNTELQNKISNANGRRKTRVITEREVDDFMQLVKNADESTHTIRVYSYDGFVPNSYKYRCEISYLEANRVDGEFTLTCRTTDAKRSHGNGALVAINGRAA